MRVTVCSNAFKECLSASDACAAMSEGIPDGVDVQTCPLADGGDSSLEVLVEAGQGKQITTKARDPLGRIIQTTYGMVGKTAIIEMARVSGLCLLSESEKNPNNTSTCGTGDLIRHAVTVQKATSVILCIGGSATNDCGCGMAEALGYQFLDSHGHEIPSPITGSHMGQIRQIRKPRDPIFEGVSVTVACDVTNPLLGPKGATAVFGGQKGIKSQRQREHLESGMRNVSKLLSEMFPQVEIDVAGGGAAGGLGYGALTFLSANFKRGFDICAEAVDLSSAISKSDLVITGEGHIDHQTASGKVPSGVASLCLKHSKPLVIIAGGISNYPLIKKSPILGSASIFSLVNKPMSLTEAMKPQNAKSLLSECVANIFNIYMSGRQHSAKL